MTAAGWVRVEREGKTEKVQLPFSLALNQAKGAQVLVLQRLTTKLGSWYTYVCTSNHRCCSPQRFTADAALVLPRIGI